MRQRCAHASHLSSIRDLDLTCTFVTKASKNASTVASDRPALAHTSRPGTAGHSRAKPCGRLNKKVRGRPAERFVLNAMSRADATGSFDARPQPGIGRSRPVIALHDNATLTVGRRLLGCLLTSKFVCWQTEDHRLREGLES